jgi:DNA-binding PadR family transcriptional regulator
MAENKSEIFPGALGLALLKALTAMSPLPGRWTARRIEQISEQALEINQGTIYGSLVRRQQRGWIAAAWGSSENNREAEFCGITEVGCKQLSEEAAT